MLPSRAAPERPVLHCIVITGASRGLGRALALACAKPGALLGLVARDQAALVAVADECRAKGAETACLVADITVPDALKAWLGALDQRHPITLFIANAGHFDGRRSGADRECPEAAIGQLRINLEGTIRTIDSVLPLMRARGRGQIAAISSLAAAFPLADAPAYSASKAGLAAYCEALHALVAPWGVHVSVVFLGHVATRQAQVHDGALPMLMSPENAARRILSALSRRRARIWLPASLALLARMGALLPLPIRSFANQRLRFSVRDPARLG